MYSKQNHIIDKVVCQICTKDENVAVQIKNSAASFINEDLLPAIEQLFDRYDLGGEIIRFDKLEVDFSISDWTKREGLKIEMLKQVERKISELKPELNSELLDDDYKNNETALPNLEDKQCIKSEENYRNTFLFFLENGYLPWYGKHEYIKQVVESRNWCKNLENKYFVKSLKALLQKNSSIIERMVFQFSNETITELLKVINGIVLHDYSRFLVYVNNTDTEERNIVLQYVLKHSLHFPGNKFPQLKDKLEFFEELLQVRFNVLRNEVTNEQVLTFLQEIESKLKTCLGHDAYGQLFELTEKNKKEQNGSIKDIVFGAQLGKGKEELMPTDLENKSTIISTELVNSTKEKEPPFFYNDNKQVIVKNAGLVLFYPFLKILFTTFNWLEDNGNIKIKKRFKAVQTLHYCATGSEDFFEDRLMFEKFLCGLPLQISIPVKTLLTAKIKEEVDNMLKVVVRHWPALKNTSSDGLRQMFVHRDGKLIKVETGFRLIVERKAQDILLDKLPWNISIVKLPWKDDLLFVEW